ncbi:cell envelope biogenesis protein AsmA [Roseicyclus marinus]|uniref:Cell envelope biogenesis protein AsmA n=2 Tax=Roseicyclus marinus TaxID=2161673 RepID=A0AA48HAZ5_9RHOB|nr:cell envelope biogenesis protein AsmA [Roseicyclus marinus]
MRWVFRAFGGLVVVAVLMFGALFAVPADRIASVAADRLSQTLGREVRLSGEVRPTLWPYLGVRAEGLRVGNPDWAGDAPLIAAEALSLRVPWSAALAGEVRIEEITLIAPEITLVRAADGRVSWSFDAAGVPEGVAPSSSTAEPAPGTTTTPTADAERVLAVTAAEISGGRFTYLDQGSGDRLSIDDLDARLSLPAEGAATIAGSATVNGTALDLDARIGDPRRLSGGGISAITAALDWAGGAARFDGQAGLHPSFAGDLDIDATDLGPLLAILGAAMPDLPQGYGRDRLAFSGEVTLTAEGSLHLRGGALGLDDTALALDLDVTPGADRPMVRGAISGARLALPDAGGAAPAPASGGGATASGSGTSGAGAAAASASGWSRAPIDVSGLFAVDAELVLAVERLEGAGVTLGPARLRAGLNAGRLVLDIERIGTYGGVLAGQFVVNGRGGLSVRTDLILADVDLNPLLADLAGYDRLEGRGSLGLQVLGVGNDMATLMSSLEGEGDFALGTGAIRGLDLAGMIRNFDPSFRGEGARTVYDGVSANVTFSQGVMSNDDLRLDAPWGEVTGAGRVNIGAQTLDYRLTPAVLRAEAGAALRVPILITGSWADPSIRPDLEFLAEQELAEEAARLEAEARARLDAEAARLEEEARNRINEALGTQFDATTTEEAARDELERRLREEAEQQLLRLLGRN